MMNTLRNANAKRALI